MNLTFAIILLVLAIGGVVARKTYYYLPAAELKRRAGRKDPLAEKLYPAVAYGSSLRALLWIFIGLSSAGGFVLLARSGNPWASFLVVILVLWTAFYWLPASRVTRVGARLTSLVTPAIVRLLNYVHPLLSRVAGLAERRYTAPEHTGLYERDDFLKLIEQQQWQKDSRISPEELEIAKRALNFEDHKVADILVPRKQIKTILASDTIGPILIDELHKSGQDYVLVRDKDKSKGMVVGTLEFKKLGLGSAGKVRDHMSANIYYIHENDSLGDALHAFFVTNHSLFIVVNSSEEYVGIISIEDIIKQLLGHIPGDDFEQFSNMEAVAGRHHGPKKSEPIEGTPVKTEAEVLE